MFTLSINPQKIFPLIFLILLGVHYRSPVLLAAPVILFLSAENWEWNSKKKILLLVCITFAATCFGICERSLYKKNILSSKENTRNDTLFVENPPQEFFSNLSEKPDSSIHLCQVTITNQTILPLHYIFPVAGKRNLNREVFSDVVNAFPALEQFTLITNKCDNHEKNLKLLSMLYSRFTRESRIASGSRDTFHIDLTQPIANPSRPDILYWYDGPNKTTPFLESTFSISVIIAVILLSLFSFCANGRNTLFRFSTTLPAVSIVFVTYFSTVAANISTPFQIAILISFPAIAITTLPNLYKYISPKTQVLLFTVWCLLYYVYRSQIVFIFSGINSFPLFAILLIFFITVTFLSTPKILNNNFRMQLLGTGIGYSLLSLHANFGLSLFYASSIVLVIMTQIFGIGRTLRKTA